MIQVRNNALYPLCSGRSETFFLPKEQLVLISEDTCKIYLASCVDPLIVTSDLFLYLDTIAELHLERTRASGQPPTNTWRITVRDIRQKLNAFNSRVFIKKLKKLLISDGSEKQVPGLELCNEFIAIAGPSWVETMLHNFKQLTNAFHQFLEQFAENITMAIEKMLANHHRKVRLLQDNDTAKYNESLVEIDDFKTPPSNTTMAALEFLDIKGDVFAIKTGMFLSSVDTSESTLGTAAALAPRPTHCRS